MHRCVLLALRLNSLIHKGNEFAQAVRDLWTASFEGVIDVYVASDMSLMKDVVDMLFEDVPPLLLGGVCGAVLLVCPCGSDCRACHSVSQK